MRTCKKCQQHFPSSIVIDGIKRSLKARTYCLQCSPFKGLILRRTYVGTEANLYTCKQCNKQYIYIRTKCTKSICRRCIAHNHKRSKKIKSIEHKGGCCQKCGYKKCYQSLSFHHIDPKTKKFGINVALLNGVSWSDILSELDKCILLCFNCHAEIEHPALNDRIDFFKSQLAEHDKVINKLRTCLLCKKEYLHKRNNTRTLCHNCISKRQDNLNKDKSVKYKGGHCIICGYSKSLAALTFHHLDPKLKSFNIGDRQYRWSRVKAELNKCILLCHNCHFEVEAGITQLPPEHKTRNSSQ